MIELPEGESENSFLDLKKGWSTYDEAARKTDNPRHKAILETMKDHYKWEALGRPDKILETVAENGVYKFWGSSR